MTRTTHVSAHNRNQMLNDPSAKRDAVVNQSKPYDLVGQIIAYEDGSLSDKDAIELFSHLIKNGQAWTLQGSYGRTASRLIEEGILDKQGNITSNKWTQEPPASRTAKSVLGHAPKNNTDVAQAFAQGATSGEKSHVFIEGDTIYSYGTHFPIARRIPGTKTALFTTRGYSTTTAKHKSQVHSALTQDGYDIIETKDPNTTNYEEVYKELTARQLELDTKRTHARSDNVRGRYTSEISSLSQQISNLSTLPGAESYTIKEDKK